MYNICRKTLSICIGLGMHNRTRKSENSDVAWFKYKENLRDGLVTTIIALSAKVDNIVFHRIQSALFLCSQVVTFKETLRAKSLTGSAKGV